MACATTVRWSPPPANDQRPAPGDARHNSVGTSLAVATNLRRDARSKSRIGSKLFTEVLWSDRETAGLFKRASQLQYACFAEVRPQNLHADGKLLFRYPAWNRNARNPCQRSCNCIYISQIHLQRVGCLLPELERRSRRRRRHNRIHFLKRFGEISCNQSPHLLRAQIISIVIPRRQRIGAKHQPPLHLRTKASFASLPIHIDQCRTRDP